MTMKPYYQDDAIMLYLGDSRDVVRSLNPGSADVLITDPPYGVNWRSNRRAERFDYITGDDGSTPPEEFVRPFLHLLPNTRHVYVFGLRDFGDLPIGGQCELIWDKGIIGPGDLSLPFGPEHEVIRFGVYVKSKANRERGDGRLSARSPLTPQKNRWICCGASSNRRR